MRPNRPEDLLRDILDFIGRIEEWTPAEGTSNDEKTFYTILHALQYIGEAVTRLPADVTALAPTIPWSNIRSMRNVVARDYAGVDSDIVWTTVRERLPELRAAVTSMLERLPRS